MPKFGSKEMNGVIDLAQDSQPIYLETNFFIKAVEGTPEAAAPPRKLIQALRARPGLAATSEITFAETLAPAQRKDAMPLHLKRRVYLNLLLWSGFVTLIPVSRDVLIETADLRGVKRMKLPDAIHLVSAMRSRCRFLVSSDIDFEGLPQGMTRIEPDHDGIENLLKTFA
jgi:predicted nucleic acid-binding protein